MPPRSYLTAIPRMLRSTAWRGRAARLLERKAPMLAVWLWDAREHDAFAGTTTLAFASVVIPDRKQSYIPADIPGSRSWSTGSSKQAPARRSPLRPPEWP